MKSNSSRLVLAGALALGSLPAVHAQTWDGGGSDNNWGTAANWTNDLLPNNTSAGGSTADVTFNTADAIINLDGLKYVKSLTINANTVFGGSSLSFNSNTDQGLILGENVTAIFNNALTTVGSSILRYERFLGKGSMLTFKNSGPNGGAFKMNGATINYQGNVVHNANPQFTGVSGTNVVNYASTTDNFSNFFRFHLAGNAQFVVKSTANGGPKNNGVGAFLSLKDTAKIVLEKDFSVAAKGADSFLGTAGTLGIGFNPGVNTASSNTVAVESSGGAYTLTVNQLTFSTVGDQTLTLNDATVQVGGAGDADSGVLKGMSVGSSEGAGSNVTGNRKYTLVGGAKAGAVRLESGTKSTFNPVTTTTTTPPVNNLGAHLEIGNKATLVNNGTFTNKFYTTPGAGASKTGLTVASGGTLAGTGSFDLGTSDGATVAKNVEVSGKIAPGDGVTPGTLSLTVNDLTWNCSTGNEWAFHLGAANTADLLDIQGNFKGTRMDLDSTFCFDLQGSTHEGTFKLVDWTGTTSFVGTDFSYTNLGEGLTGVFALNGSQLDLTVSAIPEPSTFAGLAGLAALAFGVFSRRQVKRTAASNL
jgi:hypothetical protein